jgi:hypothetical protein
MRNQPVVSSPFGVPDPLSAADEVVTELADEVAAAGAAAKEEVTVQSTNDKRAKEKRKGRMVKLTSR